MFSREKRFLKGVATKIIKIISVKINMLFLFLINIIPPAINRATKELRVWVNNVAADNEKRQIKRNTLRYRWLSVKIL